MKILHVIPYFAPAWGYGGTPRAVYEIAKNQVKQGYQVTVLTTDTFDSDKRIKKTEEKIEGIKVKRLKNISNFIISKFHFPLILGIKFDLNEFDVVHLHETRNLLNLMVLNKIKDQKVFLTPWGTLPYNNQMEIIKRNFDKLFLRLYKRKINTIFVQNDHEKKVADNFFPSNKKELIPLGVDIYFFKKMPTKKTSREKLNIKSDEFIFLFLGRYAKVKVGSLIKYFNAFEGNAKLIMVGRDDGYLREMESDIRKYHLEDKIKILPPLYEKDRLYAYASADCFVYAPSIFEETSTACLEALVSGIPVITTKEASIPLVTSKDGVYEVENNEEDFVKAMKNIYDKKIKINKQKIYKYFGWNSLTKQLVKEYEK